MCAVRSWDGTDDRISEEATTDDGDKRCWVENVDTKKAPWKNCFMVQRFLHRDGGQYPRNHGTAFLTNLRRAGPSGRGRYVVLLTAAHVLVDGASKRLVPKIRLLHASDLAEAESVKQGCTTALLDLKVPGSSTVGWYEVCSGYERTGLKTCRRDYGAIFVASDLMEIMMSTRGGIDEDTCYLIAVDYIAKVLRRRADIVVTVAGYGARYPVRYYKDGSGRSREDLEAPENHRLLYAEGTFVPHLSALGPHDRNTTAIHVADTSEGTSGGPVFIEYEHSGRYCALAIHCMGVQSDEFAELCTSEEDVPPELKEKKAVNLAENITDELRQWCEASESPSAPSDNDVISLLRWLLGRIQYSPLSKLAIICVMILIVFALVLNLWLYYPSRMHSHVQDHLHARYMRHANIALNRLTNVGTTTADVPFKRARLAVLSKRNQMETDSGNVKGSHFKQEGDISLAELFLPFRSRSNVVFLPPKGVMVYGVAGVGKTTYFTKVLPYQWSNSELLANSFHLVLVFSLELRNVQGAEDLHQLLSILGISTTAKPQAFKETMELLDKQEENVLLVFDALDQGESKLSPFMEGLICGKILPKARIIITARATPTTIEFAGECVDRELELQPFTVEESVNFLIDQKCLKNDSVPDLADLFESRELTVPLFLTMLCDFMKGPWQQIPPTKFLLFQESILKLFLLDDKRRKVKDVPLRMSYADVPDMYRDDIQNLQQLAFYGWENNIAVFPTADLHRYNVSMERMERVGLLLHHGVPDMSSRMEMRYTFQHQLFLEFFAAWHMTSVLNDLSVNESNDASTRVTINCYGDSDFDGDISQELVCELRNVLGKKVWTIIDMPEVVAAFFCGGLRQQLHARLLDELSFTCNRGKASLSVHLRKDLGYCLKEMVPDELLVSDGRRVDSQQLKYYQIHLAQSVLNGMLQDSVERCDHVHGPQYPWQLEQCTDIDMDIIGASAATIEAVGLSVLQNSTAQLSLELYEMEGFSCSEVRALGRLLSGSYRGHVSKLKLHSHTDRRRLLVCDIGDLASKPSLLSQVMMYSEGETAMDVLSYLSKLSLPKLYSIAVKTDVERPKSTGALLNLVQNLASVSHLSEFKLRGKFDSRPAGGYAIASDDAATCRSNLIAAVHNLSSRCIHIDMAVENLFLKEIIPQLETIPAKSIFAHCVWNPWIMPSTEPWKELTSSFAQFIRAPLLPGNLLVITPRLLLSRNYEAYRLDLLGVKDFESIAVRYKLSCVVLLMPSTATQIEQDSWVDELLDLAEMYVMRWNATLCIQVMSQTKDQKSIRGYSARSGLSNGHMHTRHHWWNDVYSTLPAAYLRSWTSVLVVQYRPHLDYSNMYRHYCMDRWLVPAGIAPLIRADGRPPRSNGNLPMYLWVDED